MHKKLPQHLGDSITKAKSKPLKILQQQVLGGGSSFFSLQQETPAKNKRLQLRDPLKL